MALPRTNTVAQRWLLEWIEQSRQRIAAAREDAEIGAVDLEPVADHHWPALQDLGIRSLQTLGVALKVKPTETLVMNGRHYELQTIITVQLPPREAKPAAPADDAPTFVDLMAA